MLGSGMEIYTEYMSLKYVVMQKELNIRLRSWHELMADYDIYLQCHPGKINIVSDILSMKHTAMFLTQLKELFEKITQQDLEIVLSSIVT